MRQAEAHRNRAEMAEEEVFEARRTGEAALRQARDAAEQACADLRAALAAETKRADEALQALREAEERLGAERTLMAEQSQAALDEAISDWEAKAEEDARELERVINERDSQVAAAQAMLRAVEEQVEAENTALQSDTKRQIEAERAASLAARAQAALLRKKLAVATYQLQQMRATNRVDYSST
jgi:colicin import membrane protein